MSPPLDVPGQLLGLQCRLVFCTSLRRKAGPVLDTGLESGEADKMDSGFRRNDGAKSALNLVASARQ